MVCYIQDVKNILNLLKLQDGSFVKNFPLDVGTITGYSGKREQTEMFFQFASFLSPGKIYHVDLANEAMEAKVNCILLTCFVFPVLIFLECFL